MDLLLLILCLAAMVWLGYMLYTSMAMTEHDPPPYQPLASSSAKQSKPETNSQPKPKSKPSQGKSEARHPPLPTPEFDHLKAPVEDLATLAWQTSNILTEQHFLLTLADLDRVNSVSEILDTLLSHARRIAPGLSVPDVLAQVVCEPLPPDTTLVMGNDEGWLTLTVDSHFLDNRLIAQAILAHEACHYILENSGYGNPDTEEFERIVDLCTFVCGFGPVFLAGYQQDQLKRDYRPNHWLGSMTEHEYAFVQNHVLALRQANLLPLTTELDHLKQRLLALMQGDRAACRRLMENALRQYPDRSIATLMRDAIDRLEHDRR